MQKKTTTKVVVMLIAILTVASMLPVMVFANEETDTAEGYVYLSVSFDGQYIDDQNGEPMIAGFNMTTIPFYAVCLGLCITPVVLNFWEERKWKTLYSKI